MSAKIKYPIVNGTKQCGDCKEWKSVSEFNKARTHLSSRCHSCLGIYAKKYRQRPDVKSASSLYHKSYMQSKSNRDRRNVYNRKRNKKKDVRAKRNASRRTWALSEKKKAVDYKGGRCMVCGYDKCLAALDFHHVNPKEKEGYGTGALKQHWTFEKNKSEIDKCVLVCVRCHREIHAGVTECPSVS
ncbi:MAG: HNH endonuclease signature motif containing protein [Sedimentisphaerales bacterium]|nr:HNH endonuclease signature motif containing protein [Sedimentisphaerales bacterium]